MINHKNNSDDFLKDFLQKADIESPSGDFTKMVMQKVNESVQEPSFYQQVVLKIKGWYFLAIIGFGALAYTMYYFFNQESNSALTFFCISGSSARRNPLAPIALPVRINPL